MINLFIVLSVLTAFTYFGFTLLSLISFHKDQIKRVSWALIGIYITCGAHHLHHASHVLLHGRTPGLMEYPVLIAQFAFGLTWLALRVEAMAGGRGDRQLRFGRNAGLLDVVLFAYLALVLGSALQETAGAGWTFQLGTASHFIVGVFYVIIASMAVTVQKRQGATWSLSGTTFSAYFLNCGVGHILFALYALRGTFVTDEHTLIISALSVIPAVWIVAQARALRQVPPRLRGERNGWR